MDNKTVRKALRKSIKNWCLDIRKPLLDGDSINRNSNCINRNKSGLEVRMYAENYELCAQYSDSPTLCGGCPLALIGEACVDKHSAYASFHNSLDIKSANYMILTLIRCYKEVSNG